MKTINEEIQKIKHLFNFKKGDRLIVENTGDTLPDANACEIQKFLEKNGFLEKDSYEYCKFHDTSAKALGDYIESKLGVDLGIENLKDLQDYMKLIGFDTGTYGFGPIMAKKVSELISLLENLKENILNNDKLFDFIKVVSNEHLKKLKGKYVTTINHYKEDVKLWFDLNVKQPLYLDTIEISKIDRNLISVYGEVGGNLEIELGGIYSDNQQMSYSFTADIEYAFSWGENGVCVNFSSKNGNVNSKGKSFELDYTWWTIYVEDNNVALNKGKFLGSPAGIDYVYYIDLDRILTNKIESVCLPIESMVKLIKGVLKPKDILDEVEFNKPDEELEYRQELKKKDVPGKLPSPTNYDKISRKSGGGGLYHPGKI
jgi:hypothetical protein